MPTAQQLIDQVKFDFPDRSDTELLADLQAIDDELSFTYRVRPGDLNLSITAGTQEYALTGDHVTVYSVHYATSATSRRALTETNIDYEDEFRRNWRNLSNGTPARYYVENGVIGLIPPPDTSTSGTYPRIELKTGQRDDLSLGTTMPGKFSSYEAWIAGMKYRAAVRTNDQRMMLYKAEYDRQVRVLSEQVATMARSYNRTYYPQNRTAGTSRV